MNSTNNYEDKPNEGITECNKILLGNEFLQKKRKIIILQSSPNENSPSSPVSKCLSDKNSLENSIEQKVNDIYNENTYKINNKININSNDIEIINAMLKPNITKLDSSLIKYEKYEKKKINEKVNKVKENRIKNNFDIENYFENTLKNYKFMNYLNNSSFSIPNNNIIPFNSNLNNFGTVANNQFNNLDNKNNLINFNYVNTKNINLANSNQSKNHDLTLNEEENLNSNKNNILNISEKNKKNIYHFREISKGKTQENVKNLKNDNKFPNEKFSNSSKKNNLLNNESSLIHTNNFIAKNNENNKNKIIASCLLETNLTNYLDFEYFFEYIFNFLNIDLENLKSDLKNILDEFKKENTNNNQKNNILNENGVSMKKSKDEEIYQNKTNKPNNFSSEKLNLEEILKTLFETRRKLNKLELKRRLSQIKNIIKFNTRTDKSVNIKKLNNLNIEREENEKFITKINKSFKEDSNKFDNSNSKNSLFSVNSSLEEKAYQSGNLNNKTNRNFNIYNDDSDFSDSSLKKNFAEKIKLMGDKLLQVSPNGLSKNNSNNKNFQKNNIGEIKANEILKNDSEKLNFGENPLNTFSDCFEKARIFYKKNLYYNISREKETLIYVLNYLNLGERIKKIPKINFDFKNFDKNTLIVKEKYSNFYSNNNITIFNGNNSSKFFCNGYDYQNNHFNINMNMNYNQVNNLNNITINKNIININNSNNINISNFSFDSDDLQKSNIQNTNVNLERAYVCDICNEVFSNGQGLGGHMSRKHPNQSIKYKFKKETREKRNLKREIIYEAKRRILKRYHENYDELLNTIEGRKLIKRICKDNKDEYYRIKKEIKNIK